MEHQYNYGILTLQTGLIGWVSVEQGGDELGTDCIHISRILSVV